MSGVKGKSGGQRKNSGPKKKPINTPCRVCGCTERYKSMECKQCARRRSKSRRIFMMSENAEEYLKRQKSYRKKYYQKAKLMNVEKQLMALYGLSIDEWNKMYETQNGSCFICKKPQKELKNRLHVDHCHKTGKVRALLCPKCNNAVAAYENHGDAVRKYISLFQ